ncbi:MAG: hypothetical protein DMG15_04970 [Acidobacteria bacterium]|nr:MAG: hypothetical protein DMG16_19125 [Acidobacteriota bacterium]PYS15447.1 MAG: hypothetical protein DMG15_04970 [Acidobacteriota bacterium]
MVYLPWETGSKITHVAMEATGVYWRPVWAVLEGQFALLLVIARLVRVRLYKTVWTAYWFRPTT